MAFFTPEIATKQRRISQVLHNLNTIGKVTVRTVKKDESIHEIWIQHQQQYVPDFKLIWCPGKEHYRVYIHVAHTNHEKENAGYCICVLSSNLAALAFASFYNFIHSHRANNKESS